MSVHQTTHTTAQAAPAPRGLTVEEHLQNSLIQYLPQFALMGVLLCFALFIKVKFGRRRQDAATAKLAGNTERKNAERVAIEQINSMAEEPRPSPIALTAGPVGGRHTLYFPLSNPLVSVVGASRKGKTFSAIIPMLISCIEQAFPMIVLDYKYPDTARDIVPYAIHRGYEVYPFVPGRRESQRFNVCDPIKNSRDTATAIEAVATFNANRRNAGADAKKDPFFDNAGESLFRGSLLAVKDTPYPDLLTAQLFMGLSDLPQRIDAARHLNPWTKQVFSQYLKSARSQKTAAGIETTAAGMIADFMTENFANSFIGESTIPMNLNGKKMVIVGVDRERPEAIAPLLAITISMLIEKNFADGRKLPLVLGLDELNALRLNKLMSWSNRLGGLGFQGILGIQNLAETNAVQGTEQTKALMSASATKLLFNPQELETAKMMSEYCGNEQIISGSSSHGWSAGKHNSGTQLRDSTKPLVETSEILGLDVGQAIVINPEQKNAERACVPFKERIKLDPETAAIIKESNHAWDSHTYQGLLDRAPKYQPLSFKDRDKALRELFPDPV